MADVTVNRGQEGQKRAEIEARRGIERDPDGVIIRSKKWVQERILTLRVKKSILLERLAAVDRKLKELGD